MRVIESGTVRSRANDGPRKKLARTHFDLNVYCRAYALAQRIFDVSRQFPREETYSLTSQMRRSSRAVCSNIAEAWRKRRYEAAFVSKLGDSEAEAAETQTWIQFAVDCEYLPRETGVELFREYDEVLAILVDMIRHAEQWRIRPKE